MKLLAVIILAAFAAAAPGCKHNKSGPGSGQVRKIGGCEVETIKIGTKMKYTQETPDDATWIRVSSVAFAGNDVYKKAALDLTAALASRGVSFYSCSELIHIKSGTCWPPYAVEFRIKLTQQAAERIRIHLEQIPIADHRPSKERPEGYGPFFITCGSGATDWWTVWYREEPR